MPLLPLVLAATGGGLFGFAAGGGVDGVSRVVKWAVIGGVVVGGVYLYRKAS